MYGEKEISIMHGKNATALLYSTCVKEKRKWTHKENKNESGCVKRTDEDRKSVVQSAYCVGLLQLY